MFAAALRAAQGNTKQVRRGARASAGISRPHRNGPPHAFAYLLGLFITALIVESHGRLRQPHDGSRCRARDSGCARGGILRLRSHFSVPGDLADRSF
eukprot:7390044-Prymnesium_polylepis.1